MEAAGLVLDALGRVRAMVREALKDLTPEELLVIAQAAHCLAGLAYRAGAGRELCRPTRPAAALDH